MKLFLAAATVALGAGTASAQYPVLVPHRNHYHVVPSYSPPVALVPHRNHVRAVPVYPAPIYWGYNNCFGSLGYSSGYRSAGAKTLSNAERAAAWLEVGELDKAVTDLNEAIRLDPTQAALYTARGIALYRMCKFDKAEEDFSAAIRLDPASATAYAARAKIRVATGRWDDAVKDFDEAVRLEPGSADALCGRGRLHEARQAYDQALADYDAAIRIAPTSIAYAGRATIRASCPDAKYRDGAKAVADAKTACEMTEWKDASNLALLATAHAAAGNFAEATKWLTGALADPIYATTNGDTAQVTLKRYAEKKP